MSGHGTPFRGRVVAVTGGARGIGLAIAHAAADRGASAVALLDIDEQLVHRSALEVRVVGDEGAAADCRRDGRDGRGRRNGRRSREARPARRHDQQRGAQQHAEATTLSVDEWDSAMAVDLKAAWLCAKHALAHLIASEHGSIVNIASVHAEMTAEGTFSYAVAKVRDPRA